MIPEEVDRIIKPVNTETWVRSMSLLVKASWKVICDWVHVVGNSYLNDGVVLPTLQEMMGPFPFLRVPDKFHSVSGHLFLGQVVKKIAAAEDPGRN